jgi:hypothetical protein
VNETSSILFSVSDDHTLRVWTDKSFNVSYNDLTIKENANKKQNSIKDENNNMVNFLVSHDIEISEANDSQNDNILASQSDSDDNS